MRVSSLLPFGHLSIRPVSGWLLPLDVLMKRIEQPICPLKIGSFSLYLALCVVAGDREEIQFMLRSQQPRTVNDPAVFVARSNFTAARTEPVIAAKLKQITVFSGCWRDA
jgi:hypothetical protein